MSADSRRDDHAGQVGAGDILDGRYHLLRDLGRGAAGVVFEARHLFTGRFVAVKMALAQWRQMKAPELHARLQREGQALAAIRHPGVVDVLDGGVTKDGPYVVMEMLEGRTLEGLLASRGKLSPANTVAIALQLCDALEAVHRAGIVHRDVKPANMILVRDDDGRERLKLVDFGIAYIEDPSQEKLTGLGAVIGTPAYMSPEQLQGLADVDATADVYSVGVTMFECLSGGMPYSGNYAKVLLLVTSESPAPSLRTGAQDIPVALCEVVDRAISKDRADRFSSAQELARAIRAAFPDASRQTTLLGAAQPVENAVPSPEQRRRTARTPYNTPISLVFEGGVTVDGRTEDISAGGVLVVSRADCEANRRATLRFALPMDGRVVAVEVAVRWVRAAEGRDAQGLRAIGLEFVTLPDRVRESIERYVELMTERTRA